MEENKKNKANRWPRVYSDNEKRQNEKIKRKRDIVRDYRKDLG